jgi:hypothetical protein
MRAVLAHLDPDASELRSRVEVDAMSECLVNVTPTESAAFALGVQLGGSNGERYVVVEVLRGSALGVLRIKTATWWRRLYWRIRRLFS